MTDPGLWFAFVVTVAVGYLVIAPIERRHAGGGRMSRQGR